MRLLQPKPYLLNNEEGQFLRSLGAWVSIKANSEQTGGVFNVFEVCYMPGFGTELHIHDTEDVALYVLERTLTFLWGSEKKQAVAGSFFYQPRGAAHGLCVESPVPARMMCIPIPAGFDRFVLEDKRLAPESERERAAAQHKFEIPGHLPD